MKLNHFLIILMSTTCDVKSVDLVHYLGLGRIIETISLLPLLFFCESNDA